MTINDITPQPFAINCDGIFNMSEPGYREAPGINQSLLKYFRISPAHMQAHLIEDEKEPTHARKIGLLTDQALLEPDGFPTSYYVRPVGLDLRTKEGKAWKLDHGDRPHLLTIEEETTIKTMMASVMAHPKARLIVEGGFCQPSVFCHHAPTGLLRKGRLDKLLLDANGRPVIADLKTCPLASPAAFAHDVGKFYYHVQADYYRSIVADLIGEMPHFLFIAVEKKGPLYGCAVYDLDEEDLLAGRAEWEKNLQALAPCYANELWPGYAEGIITIKMAKYHTAPRDPVIPDEEAA